MTNMDNLMKNWITSRLLYIKRHCFFKCLIAIILILYFTIGNFDKSDKSSELQEEMDRKPMHHLKHLNSIDIKGYKQSQLRNSNINKVAPTTINVNHLRIEDMNHSLFAYHAPFSGSLIGKPFRIGKDLLASLDLPLREYIVLSDQNVNSFVFVTAVDFRFYAGLTHLIHSIQAHFPDKSILVYDLGLRDSQLDQLRKACNVKIKVFDDISPFLPKHVLDASNYAFKPLVIHDALRTNQGVFWVDSSIRIRTSNITNSLRNIVHVTRGFMMFTNTGHSNYAVTAKQMYHYLPTRLTEMKRIEQLEGNAMLIYRTRDVYTNILQWLTLCALDHHCIAPINIRFCPFGSERFSEYVYCHRFDQSAVNILAANYVDFQDASYRSPDKVVNVIRGEDETVSMTQCS